MPAPLEVRIKTVPEVTVAYLVMRGPFKQIPEGLKKLYGWVMFKGLTPSGPPSGVYPVDPEAVPPDQLEWELRAPVSAGAAPVETNAEGLGVKKLPPAEVASTVHKGSYRQLARVWKGLAEWIVASGYAVAGPGEEVYMSPPETPPAETLTEVRIPVRKG